LNHCLSARSWSKDEKSKLKEFENECKEVLQNTYRKVDALLRPKFKNKKFCNCCGKCCKSMLIPIMPLEAINIGKRLRENKAFFERCLDYYIGQIRGGIENYKNCPYQLDDNTCGIYDIRPFTCRAWLSTKENCLNKATTSGSLFHLGKIMAYYHEVLKDLFKFAASLTKDADFYYYLINPDVLIQNPFLTILSKRQERDFFIQLMRDIENNLIANVGLSRDFTILVETLSGKTLNESIAA
jgi:hypothetical protein